jgi:ABC-type spermidine/putrescine transport system permease subunit I
VLLVPLLIVLVLLFLYPIARVVLRSFGDADLTLDNYLRIFTVDVYRVVLLNTFRTALTVTVICVVLGYPLAYLMSTVGPRARAAILTVILISFWTSVLIRSYGWVVLFGRRGILNDLLISLHLISEPLPLVQNSTGMYIGMVQVLLPYAILPLFAVMQGLDRRLVLAAQSLGAPPLQQFLRVFLPSTLPGVWAGSLLVFILALGFFVTPALLGGPKDMLIAVLIYQQTSALLNWPFASALAAVLLGATLVLYVVAERFVGLRSVLGVAR